MSSHRILIVEDQREVSRLLRSALETLEYDLVVDEIPSGEEAILDSSRTIVDLLVADYRLPGMTGIELMHKVKKNHPRAKVILVTGQTDPRIRKQVAEAGADAIFLKPIPMVEFLDSVERALGLVETVLPPELVAVDEEQTLPGLPDLLAGMRQELGATAVFLLNDAGRVLARAGDLQDRNNEDALISALLSIYSAGQKVSHLIEQPADSNWYFFDSGKNELVFAPVGHSHAMLVIGKDLTGEQMAKVVNIFSAARKDIEKSIGETPPDESSPAEQPGPSEEVAEPQANDLEPLFKEATTKLKPTEVDDFWTKAADEHRPPAKPDMLSFEQARQLGLTPEEES